VVLAAASTVAWALIEGTMATRFSDLGPAGARVLWTMFLNVGAMLVGLLADPQYYRGAGALDYYVPAYCGLVWAAVGLLALPVHLAR
jgi:hypothetical protein